MRRLLRWAFNVTAAVSAAALVPLAYGWAASYPASIHWGSDRGRVLCVLISAPDATPGQLAKALRDYPDGTSVYNELQQFDLGSWKGAGLEVGWGDGKDNTNPLPSSATYRLVAFPYWLPFLLAACAPAAWLASAVRRGRRGRRGRCAHCGYDLRATPDRCPECGTVPTAAR